MNSKDLKVLLILISFILLLMTMSACTKKELVNEIEKIVVPTVLDKNKEALDPVIEESSMLKDEDESETERETDTVASVQEEIPEDLSLDPTIGKKFMFPEHADRLLNENDLSGLTKQELRMGRNEIYAKYGRQFQSDEVRGFMALRGWYRGTIDPKDFKEDILSTTERANVAFLLKSEESAPDGNRERIRKIVKKYNADRKRYYLRLCAGNWSDIIEHDDCYEITNAALLIALDPIPKEELEGKHVGDTIIVNWCERTIFRSVEGYYELRGYIPDGMVGYNLPDWLIEEEYGYVPMMANDCYVSQWAYEGSIYLAKDCKIYGVEILGNPPQTMSVHDYLFHDWDPDNWEVFEYGLYPDGIVMYGFIECNDDGIITEYRELYQP